jgi:hypothetical protein
MVKNVQLEQACLHGIKVKRAQKVRMKKQQVKIILTAFFFMFKA